MYVKGMHLSSSNKVVRFINEYLPSKPTTEEALLIDANSGDYIHLVAYDVDGTLTGFVSARKVNAPLGNVLLDAGYEDCDFDFFSKHGVSEGYLIITRAVVIPDKRDEGVLFTLLEELNKRANKLGYGKGIAVHTRINEGVQLPRLASLFDCHLIIPNFYGQPNVPHLNQIPTQVGDAILGIKSLQY